MFFGCSAHAADLSVRIGKLGLVSGWRCYGPFGRLRDVIEVCCALGKELTMFVFIGKRTRGWGCCGAAAADAGIEYRWD